MAMWSVRLSLFTLPTDHIHINVLALLAPPYLMVFGFGNTLARHDPEPPATGPMSIYSQNEESARKWKVRIAAGLVATFNLLLLVFVG
jgi:hypothetical protein